MPSPIFAPVKPNTSERSLGLALRTSQPFGIVHLFGGGGLKCFFFICLLLFTNFSAKAKKNEMFSICLKGKALAFTFFTEFGDNAFASLNLGKFAMFRSES